MHKLISYLLLLVLVGCSYPNVRDDYKSFMGIEYGECQRMGSIVMIAIKNLDSLDRNDIFSFVYCLVKNEEQQLGRPTSLVEIYNHFYYVRGDAPKDLKVLYYFYFDNKLVGVDFKSETFLRRIKKLDPKNQYIDLDTLSFFPIYPCDK